VKYAFILNPAAGSGHSLKVMESVEKVLTEQNIAYAVLRTDRPGHATEIAGKLADDLSVTAVAAVGGDGTVSEVAAGLAGTGKPMGIIPAGTGNDLIKSALGFTDPMKALETLLLGRTRLTDTGSINDGFFMNVCGTGFDVTVLDCAARYKARFRGLIPYLLGFLKAIFHYSPVRLKITMDGKEESGEYLVCSIANGKIIGGGIPICPAASLWDGKLDIVLIENVPRWKIPLYMPGLMSGKDLSFRIARHVLAEKIVLEGHRMRVNVDGEIRSLDRAVFCVHPGHLRLICP